MDLLKVQLLIEQYKDADVFQQNSLAVEFMELYAANMLNIAKGCSCTKLERDKIIKRELANLNYSVNKLIKDVEGKITYEIPDE